MVASLLSPLSRSNTKVSKRLEAAQQSWRDDSVLLQLGSGAANSEGVKPDVTCVVPQTQTYAYPGGGITVSGRAIVSPDQCLVACFGHKGALPCLVHLQHMPLHFQVPQRLHTAVRAVSWRKGWQDSMLHKQQQLIPCSAMQGMNCHAVHAVLRLGAPGGQ